MGAHYSSTWPYSKLNQGDSNVRVSITHIYDFVVQAVLISTHKILYDLNILKKKVKPVFESNHPFS